MKINSINNFQQITSFKGYKNVITEQYDIPSHDAKIIHLIAQLDNEGGNAHLDKFNEINRLMGKPETDVMICVYSKIGNRDCFLINEEELPPIEYLKANAGKSNLDKKFAKEEQFALKTYTLLANITNKMSNNNLNVYDGDFGATFKKAFEYFTEYFGGNKIGEQRAFHALNVAVLKNSPIDLVASQINEIIQFKMKKLFR